MYDESTVIVPIPFTTDDYFVLIQLARRKNMTRSQLIMDALKQYLLVEQEKWRKEEEERRIAEKIIPKNPRPRPEGEDPSAEEKKKEKEKGGEK
jgi:metal-responsive CopG/Arc/MetJ family transcriptional regulator